MTDPTPTQPGQDGQLRAALKAALHPVLHDLDVRITALTAGDCHCNLIAEVTLDALIPALDELGVDLADQLDQAHAAGYAAAVANLRDDERFLAWWRDEANVGRSVNRIVADYLAAVGPQRGAQRPETVPDGADRAGVDAGSGGADVGGSGQARRHVRTLYRSVEADGRTWCESSVPDDFREHAKPGLTYQKLETFEVETGWQPWGGPDDEAGGSEAP